MSKRKILVTGSRGTVGSYVAAAFPQDTVFLTSKDTLDITKKSQVKEIFTQLQPQVIIHLAAHTNVDDCQKNSDKAYKVNTHGTRHIAEEAARHGTTVLYVSSAAVFDGKKSFYTEEDVPGPINIYGQSKLLGEKAIQNLVPRYIVLRAGWIVGGGMKEKKFISYLLQQVKQGSQNISVVNDTFGTLTSAAELVATMKVLLDSEAVGCYHFGSAGVCSRYEIAQHIVNALRLKVTINPVPSTYFADRFFAPRPTYEVLRSIRYTPHQQYTWEESLTTYINNELRDA